MKYATIESDQRHNVGQSYQVQAKIVSASVDEIKLHLFHHVSRVEETGLFRLGISLLILVFISFCLLAYVHRMNLPSTVDAMLVIAVATVTVIPFVSAIYITAYKFYRDNFYFFIAVGWGLNLLYILLEAFFSGTNPELSFRLSVTAFSIISFIPFYLATFITKKKKKTEITFALDIRGLKKSLLRWLIWFLLVVVSMYLSLSLSSKQSTELYLTILVLGGIPFSTFTLLRVGKSFESRLNRNVLGIWATILPYTFYIYGLLQTMYLLKVASDSNILLYLSFFLAFLLKTFNGISTAAVISKDLRSYESGLKNALNDRDKMNEELNKKNILADLGALTASIEHEIRNPLGVMEFAIERMRNKFQANTEVVEYINKIEEQRQRTVDAMKMIPIFRADESHNENFMKKENVEQIARKSVKAIIAEMKPANIIIRVKDSGQENVLYTLADKSMVEQAIVNILKNSIESIREAKREQGLIEVMVKTNLKSEIKVEVSDNGCGIPSENLTKLTTLFSTKKGRKPNSGIGLFITERIMTLHSGRLEVTHTEIGKGTVCSLYLPRLIDYKHEPLSAPIDNVSNSDSE